MIDIKVKINKKHNKKFLEIIDMLEPYKKYKYTITEKMNGNVVVNFVKDIDDLITDFPDEKDFFERLRKVIKAKRVFEPIKLVIIFVNGDDENEK